MNKPKRPFARRCSKTFDGQIVSFSSRSCKIAIGNKAVKISHEDMARVCRCEVDLRGLIVELFNHHTQGTKHERTA